MKSQLCNYEILIVDGVKEQRSLNLCIWIPLMCTIFVVNVCAANGFNLVKVNGAIK